MTKVEHGFNLAALRAELDSEEWGDSDDGDMQVRRVYLGTVFGLTPSGKFYAPFACSNVMGCDSCGGHGTVRGHRRSRVAKRWQARAARIRRVFDARVKVNDGAARAWVRAHHAWKRGHGVSCAACGGSGSREAHLDELWREVTEEAFAGIGACLANGEGDPCDMFAEEYRDKPEESEDEVA